MPDQPAACELPVLAVRATMPNAEFPRRETLDICRQAMEESMPRELRNAELTLQWFYSEQEGTTRHCPPRTGIEIRRDIRKQRIRLRRVRKVARAVADGLVGREMLRV